MHCPGDYHCSESFLFFLSSLLEQNIQKRFTIQDVIESPWFKDSLSKLNKNFDDLERLNPIDINFNLDKTILKINNLSLLRCNSQKPTLTEEANENREDKVLQNNELDQNLRKKPAQAQKNGLSSQQDEQFNETKIKQNVLNGDFAIRKDIKSNTSEMKRNSMKTLQNEDDFNHQILSMNSLPLALHTKESSDFFDKNSKERSSFNSNNSNVRNNDFLIANKQGFQLANKNDIILEILEKSSARSSLNINQNSSFRDFQRNLYDSSLKEIERNSKRESINQINAIFLETQRISCIVVCNDKNTRKIETDKFPNIDFNMNSKENKRKENSRDSSRETKVLTHFRTGEQKKEDHSHSHKLSKFEKTRAKSNSTHTPKENNNHQITFSDILMENLDSSKFLGGKINNKKYEFVSEENDQVSYSDIKKNKALIVGNLNDPKAKNENNYFCFRGDSDMHVFILFIFNPCLTFLSYLFYC